MTINPLPPTVVGLDPSLTAFGIAGPSALRTLKTPPAPGLVARRERLRGMVRAVTLEVATAAGGGLALVVIETPAYDSRTGSQHDRSGLWWLVVDALLEAGHLVVEITGGQRAKYATGKGTAGKTAVASAAALRYGIPFGDDNQADAFVLRAMGLHAAGRPLASVPKTHAAALEAVAWPTAGQLDALAAIDLGVEATRILRGDLAPGQLTLDHV